MNGLIAVIPCYNNAVTLEETIASVRAQAAVKTLVVIDDGSRDDSAAVAERLGAEVLRMGENRGRGAVRARAMELARERGFEWLLFCDATAALAPDFVERATAWMASPTVAAIQGRMQPGPQEGLVDRWRSRHLFKCTTPAPLLRRAGLMTAGCLLRGAACEAVGGFNPALRHSEDADLGDRLLSEGWDVVADPALGMRCTVSNTARQVLERYWRWNAGVEEQTSWIGYVRLIAYAVKCMAVADLRAGDPAALGLTLVAPHYQFWRSRVRSWRRGR
jgi:glycosyltransferase involved in cell wall biosynthesis